MALSFSRGDEIRETKMHVCGHSCRTQRFCLVSYLCSKWLFFRAFPVVGLLAQPICTIASRPSIACHPSDRFTAPYVSRMNVHCPARVRGTPHLLRMSSCPGTNCGCLGIEVSGLRVPGASLPGSPDSPGSVLGHLGARGRRPLASGHLGAGYT